MSIVARRILFAALSCAALVPGAARAHDWDVTGRVGIGLPVGDLGDGYDPGFSATLSTTCWFGDRYGLRLGGAGNFLGGATALIPNGSFWHYGVGPELALLDPAQRFKLNVHAGIGATTLQPDGGSSSTDFTVNAGATLEYKVNAAWSVIGGPSFYIIAADKTGYILPISGGFRYLFGTR